MRCWIVCGLMPSTRASRRRRSASSGVGGGGIATTSPRLPSRSLRACGHRLTPFGGEVALGLGQALGVELHDGRHLVVDERAALAVDDRAARRLHALEAHAVVGGLALVVVARQHLQVPQAEEDDPEHREGDEPERGDAHRELRRDRRAALLDGVYHARESGDSPPVV